MEEHTDTEASETDHLLPDVNTEDYNDLRTPVSTMEGQAGESSTSWTTKPKPSKRSETGSTFRLYITRTLFLYFAYICLGLNIGEGGPTFIDLLLLVKSNVEDGSIFYTSGSIGYAVGALVAGVLYDTLNRDLVLFVTLLFLGLLNVAIPWCPALWSMSTVAAFRGVTFGSLDTGGNTVCVGMWKDEGSPYLQALHLSFSIGGMIAPFIAEPFLAPKAQNSTNSTHQINNTSPILLLEDDGNTSYPILNLTEATRYHVPETHVQYAYLIIGAVTVIGAFPFFALFLRRPNIRHSLQIQKADEESAESSRRPDLSIPLQLMFLLFLGIFYMFYVGLEANLEGYLMTFLVKHLDWTKPDGARIMSVFWGTFSVGRLLGIVTSKFLSPWKMLSIDLILLNGILVPLWFVTQERDIIIWTCVPLCGVFIATIFPTGISWTDQYIMKVTGKVASVFILSSTISGIFIPMLLGYLFENVSPMWFIYLLTVCSVMCLVMFIIITVLLAIVNHRGKSYNVTKNS